MDVPVPVSAIVIYTGYYFGLFREEKKKKNQIKETYNPLLIKKEELLPSPFFNIPASSQPKHPVPSYL